MMEIELHDIGRKSGGATMGEAAKEMFGALTGAATHAAAGAGDLIKGGAKKVEEAGKAAVGLVKGLFGGRKK